MLSRLLFLVLLLSSLLACDDDAPLLPTVHEIEGKNELCIPVELPDSTVQHVHRFVPFDEHSLDTVCAYKGADEWCASASFGPGNGNGYWLVTMQANWVEAPYFDRTYDYLTFNIPATHLYPGCFPLANYTVEPGDSIGLGYYPIDYDVLIERYYLDPTAENYLEILPTTVEDDRFRARFAATFLADDSTPPYIYPKVRFTQGYIDVAR